MGVCFGVGEVVNGDYFEIASAVLLDSPEGEPPDPSEAVNADFGGHGYLLEYF
jgi:hypothetical protein